MSSVTDNYTPRKIDVTGIKFDPYYYTLDGIKLANGQVYTGNGDGTTAVPARFDSAPAIGVPSCSSCFKD